MTISLGPFWALESACRSLPSFPCSGDVRRHRCRRRGDPHSPRPRRGVLGRRRVAPTVSRHPRQRTCTGVRSGHRRLEAAAAAQDQAKITSAPGVRSPGRSRGRLAAPRARTVRLWMRETVEEIARPPVTGCTVLSHPRHEIWPMRLAACNGQKRHEQGQRER